MVATQQWYLGPGQQGDAMDDGYDQAYEDRLFEEIAGPTDGYRLFEIGNFWATATGSTGCGRATACSCRGQLLEQVGGFDERFTVAGGGYANLELYERLGTSPDITVVDAPWARGRSTRSTAAPPPTSPTPTSGIGVFGYRQQYALLGRAFRGPGKPMH